MKAQRQTRLSFRFRFCHPSYLLDDATSQFGVEGER